MRDALVSGQAGVAIFTAGDSAEVVRVSDSGNRYSISSAAIPYILSGSRDVVWMRSCDEADAVRSAQIMHAGEKACHLILMLLDPDEERETQELAAEGVNELVSNPAVVEKMLNRLCSATLPNEGVVTGLKDTFGDLEHFTKVFELLHSLQPAIGRICRAWDNVSAELFSGVFQQADCKELLIHAGTFRLLAIAGSLNLGPAQLASYQALQKVRNGRQIVANWLELLSVGENRKRQQPVVFDEEVEEESDRDVSSHRKLKANEAFENATIQKRAIVPLLHARDWVRARQYIDQLVASQLTNGKPEFAAKSLCALAQEAKAVSAYSMQLELSIRATQVAVDDGWAVGQVADAYLCLGQLANASEWFARAEALGEVAFARTGLVRVLREQGRLDEALSRITETCQIFPDEQTVWALRAEILRDMWRFDESHSAYAEAISRFPVARVLQCGRAAVLKDMGRLKDAEDAYRNVLESFDDDVVGYAGLADVLKEGGRFEEALDVYARAMNIYPDSSVLHGGRADVLCEMGKLEESLDAYDATVKDFPHDVIPQNGRAFVLLEMGRFDMALAAFDEAITSFPLDNRTRNGRAHVLKKMGRLEDSLRAYDECIKLFPYDLRAWTGRADLLKSLGHINEALDAYDVIIQRSKWWRSPQISKAAVLVATGRYQEAEALLPNVEPQTRDEWIAYHIRGMIHLRVGRIEDGIAVFRRGLAIVPFAEERKYFLTALAVANLRQRRFREAAQNLADESTPIGLVVKMHAYAAAKKWEEAKRAYTASLVNCPPLLVPVRNEIAAKYKFRMEPSTRDWEWVFEQECRGLLLKAA